jgi:putative peptidoglycan lipid II flippase
LYLLPVSLFGMAVSAAELPAMSSMGGDDATIAAALRTRVAAGLRRLTFFVVPSAVAFLALGGVLAELIFRSGRFTAADANYVWGILAGSAVGLLAATMGRLYASVFYARRDARTPLRYAVIRVVLTIVLGYFAAMHLPRLLGVSQRWGATGLTASAGIAAWIEFALLRRAAQQRIGEVDFSTRNLIAVYGAALVAAAAAWGAKLYLFHGLHRVPNDIATIAVYGMVYLAIARLLRVPEASVLLGRVARRGAR